MAVIVGGGLAASHAAVHLRKNGYEDEIVILTRESEFPYERPPLSKDYLQGAATQESLFVRDEAWYDENSVTVRTNTEVSSISPGDHTVTLSGGEVIPYDKLVLATGSTARQLPLKGHDLPGVFTLRDLADADALAEQLRDGGKKLVLIGSGWIGMEVAASARQLGNEVIVLERSDVPLQAALGPQLGKEFQLMHERHGVEFMMHADVQEITGSESVTGVRVDGQEIQADLVLIGVGATPNVELAEAAGLDVDNGVLVDAKLATSEPDIYAVGDIANIEHPLAGCRLRTEHWQTARATGRVAAQNIAGLDVQFEEIPYFYTDQYELGMELSGWPYLMSDAEVVIRGDDSDTEKGEYVVFWILDGRVVAGMSVNIWDVNKDVQNLIRNEEVVDLGRLRNPDIPLDEVLAT